MLVRGPAHQREGRAGREEEDTAAAVEHLFAHLAAEADPVLDLLLDPDELDLGEILRRRVRGAAGARGCGGKAGH